MQLCWVWGAAGPWGRVSRATPGDHTGPDSLVTLSICLQRTYIFTFLLSSRVFIPPHDLLARVGQLCVEQRQQLEAGSEKVKRAPDCAHLTHAWARSWLRMGPG